MGTVKRGWRVYNEPTNIESSLEVVISSLLCPEFQEFKHIKIADNFKIIIYNRNFFKIIYQNNMFL